MAFLVITAVAYLAGAASAVFLVAVIGIRRGDRPERILQRRFPLVRGLCPPRAAQRHLAGRPGLPPGREDD